MDEAFSDICARACDDFATVAKIAVDILPEHDPEKWTPVFGKDHAPSNSVIPKSGTRLSEKDHAPPQDPDVHGHVVAPTLLAWRARNKARTPAAL
jgi:hypothetical protein